MFRFIKNLFRSPTPKLTPRAAFMRDNDISFERGLTVHGLNVREFGYLLLHYTDNEIDGFDNLNKISKAKDKIIAKIDLELNSNRLAETVLTNDETATMNAKNLRSIILILDEYNTKYNPDNYYKK